LSATFDQIKLLVRAKNARPSNHCYASFAKRGILFADVICGVDGGIVIEDYPDFHLGPSVLVLQKDLMGKALHVVWGVEKNTTEPAVVVTAYHPDPSKWSQDFRSRKP
jgi:hypothetical protein